MGAARHGHQQQARRDAVDCSRAAEIPSIPYSCAPLAAAILGWSSSELARSALPPPPPPLLLAPSVRVLPIAQRETAPDPPGPPAAAPCRGCARGTRRSQYPPRGLFSRFVSPRITHSTRTELPYGAGGRNQLRAAAVPALGIPRVARHAASRRGGCRSGCKVTKSR